MAVTQELIQNTSLKIQTIKDPLVNIAKDVFFSKNVGCFRLANPDWDLEIRSLDFPIKHEIQKRILP